MTGRLAVCAALGLEARALAHGGVRVVRTGAGPARARKAAARLRDFDALAVARHRGPRCWRRRPPTSRPCPRTVPSPTSPRPRGSRTPGARSTPTTSATPPPTGGAPALLADGPADVPLETTEFTLPKEVRP
ncbi:hypothetical protein [Actinomadura napierensis]|uniref:hypothetical protein n=1 Tax=Actinomadura napierensis TaxID=267854 RepID=UPI0031D64C90